MAIHCLSPVMVELPSFFVASCCEIMHWRNHSLMTILVTACHDVAWTCYRLQLLRFLSDI